jgi:hypothetical protein
MRIHLATPLTLGALLASAPAFAQDPSPPGADPGATPSITQPAPPPAAPTSVELPSLMLGVRFGASVPEGFNKLTAGPLPEIELAYQLPFISHRLGLFVDAGYSWETQSGTRTDPRITTTGTMNTESWDEQIHDVGFAFGVHLWQPIADRWLVYGGVGAKLHLTKTVMNANAGSSALGENTEQSTRVGALVRVGTGVKIGPGALVFEVHFEWTGIDHLITGGERDGESANTAHLALQLGYNFFIL